MKSFAQIDIENNGNYLKLLSSVSKLSSLFSESSIPFINYRVAENIFCRSFEADNLSRSDTAFDANYNTIGVGLKTFTLPGNNSREKIAEFNQLSCELRKYENIELALKLAEFRNERIELARRLYNIDKSIYHIVARKENELNLFETDYNKINLQNIKIEKETKASILFHDGINQYSYNYSKSTLFRLFETPANTYKLPVDIIDDPYTLLLELFKKKEFELAKDRLIKGINYVVLPLYGIKNNQKFIFEKSGLNQWNAGGRKRDINEIYIPIPAIIHKKYSEFFPKKDKKFHLRVPTKELFNAKLCQDSSKALMTDPNKALSDWLLRKILKLKEGELATIEKLEKLGFDSVIILKDDDENYKIDIMKSGAYETFIQ
ncbi:MAG: hypothetical protein KAG95_06050 [Bacteroidales bacterium]|nr:hypothetical protein [Bacteroidales bacterium]